jgi:hypothetical protein
MFFDNLTLLRCKGIRMLEDSGAADFRMIENPYNTAKRTARDVESIKEEMNTMFTLGVFIFSEVFEFYTSKG